MRFLQMTLLLSALSAFCPEPRSEYPPSSPARILRSAAHPVTTNVVVPGATNLIFQSRDGGQTWQDISPGLPEDEQPEDFFAGPSDLYIRFKNAMYRSKSNLKAPVWEQENVPDPRSASIAFTRSGIIAYHYDGQIHQKAPAAGTWLPVYTNVKNQLVRTVFETQDGTVFQGGDNGLYKSIDRGRRWKQVFNGGWVIELVESEGILIGTSQRGIIRSADNGEHWEPVISEGGVGIAVERIDGGFAAISYNTSTRSRRIRISLDQGKNWKAIDEGLPPSPLISSIKQVGRYLICGHPGGIFRSGDMGKTWNLVHASGGSPFETSQGKVFKIYVSGGMLYAVAGNSGC